MANRLQQQALGWMLGAMIVAGATPALATTCAQARQLLSQGLSFDEVAGTIGAPIGFVQACAQSARIPGVLGHTTAAGPPPLGAAGPPPLGAAGPAPLGAAGPPPLGAAGPPPLGAAGPAPHGAPGPAPLGASSR